MFHSLYLKINCFTLITSLHYHLSTNNYKYPTRKEQAEANGHFLSLRKVIDSFTMIRELTIIISYWAGVLCTLHTYTICQIYILNSRLSSDPATTIHLGSPLTLFIASHIYAQPYFKTTPEILPTNRNKPGAYNPELLFLLSAQYIQLCS